MKHGVYQQQTDATLCFVTRFWISLSGRNVNSCR